MFPIIVLLCALFAVVLLIYLYGFWLVVLGALGAAIVVAVMYAIGQGIEHHAPNNPISKTFPNKPREPQVASNVSKLVGPVSRYMWPPLFLLFWLIAWLFILFVLALIFR